MEVILQDINNYDNLLNKKGVVNASNDLASFLEKQSWTKSIIRKYETKTIKSRPRDLLIDKFLNGQKKANKDIRTAEIAFAVSMRVLRYGKIVG